jgi:hypothetical protein
MSGVPHFEPANELKKPVVLVFGNVSSVQLLYREVYAITLRVSIAVTDIIIPRECMIEVVVYKQ